MSRWLVNPWTRVVAKELLALPIIPATRAIPVLGFTVFPRPGTPWIFSRRDYDT